MPTQPLCDFVLTLKLGGTLVGASGHLVGTVAIGFLSLFAWLDPQLDRAPEKKTK